MCMVLMQAPNLTIGRTGTGIQYSIPGVAKTILKESIIGPSSQLPSRSANMPMMEKSLLTARLDEGVVLYISPFKQTPLAVRTETRAMGS